MASAADGGSFRIHRETRDDVVTIKPAGELDIATAPALAAVLAEAERSAARSIVLDLGLVTFLDSAGIRMLLTAAADSRANAGKLCVRSRYTEQVRRVLEVTGVTDLLADR